jgi:1-deoxy-D-xylulose-5-phosphate synthase
MGERMRDSVKLFLIGGTFFEDMGITYLGPVDGHSIEQLRMVMQSSQQIAGPVLIHAFTKKGRGYLPAEADPELFHGASRFDIATGIFSTGSTARSYTDYFSDALVAEAKIDQRIVAITAAMPLGTGLDCFKQRFPSRFIDVGIAEEHAVASAAGMAIGGSLPVVAIYSSFLQRAYDQLMINVGLANQHVVFCLDRAGLVGEDGATHHGAFDLSYLRSIPNMQILAPAFGDQLADALHTALRLDGPVALRFPRGEAPSSLIDESGHTHESHTEQRRHQAVFLEPGRAQLLLSGSDVALLAVGSMVKPSLEAARLLAEDDISVAVYNMIWVKPIDYELVASLNHPLIVTLEEGSLVGGFGSAVLEVLSERKPQKADCLQKTLRIGIPDRFVGHGSQRELLVELGLDSKSIAATVRAALVDLVLTDQASADPASVDGQVTTSTRTDL